MITVNRILVLLCITVLCTPLLSNDKEGTYIRKSISGPISFWANQATLDALGGMTPKLENTLKESVRIPRFDLNQLPESLFETAKTGIKDHEVLSNELISQTIQDTIVPEIETILNDPIIQHKRLELLKRGKDKVSFAETKGKAANILSSDLETLFNSAYIYIPFAKAFNTHNNGITITTKITTGVAWYKILTDAAGTTSVKHIKTISVDAKSTKVIDYKKGSYGPGKEQIENLIKATQEIAIKEAGQRIRLATKKIEDFKLAGFVMESDGLDYKLNVGTLEGVQIDDAYIMMGYVEEDGEEVEKELGFLRITEVSDNRDNSQIYSTATQQLGKPQSSGGWVKEYPRTRTHFAFDIGYSTGLNIDSSEIPELKENATTAIALNATIAQNLSDITGNPQFFGEFAASLGFIDNTLDSDTTGTTLLASFYINLKKKYWYRRHATYWKLGAGYDNFKMSGHSPISGDYDYDIQALGFLFGVGYEVLLTKNLSLILNGHYKTTPFITKASGKNSSGSFDLDALDAGDMFSKTRFGGAQLSFGFNYIFPSFDN